MESEGICAICERRARTHCRRCGRPYCIEHGGAFCALCSDPASGLPSARLFQLAVWLLPVCAILGLWFLIGTPRLPGEHSAKQAASAASPTRVEQPAPATRSPAATATPTSTAAASDYTVKSGDTLQSIANAAGVTVPAIQQLNPSVDPSNLQIGQVLHMPAKSP